MSTLALYGPAALTGTFFLPPLALLPLFLPLNIIHTGALIPQFLLSRIHEQTMFTSLLLVQTFLACAIQIAGIGSAVAFLISGLSLFFSLGLNALIVGGGGEIVLWMYTLGQFVTILTGTQLMAATLDVFVPLVSFRPRVISDIYPHTRTRRQGALVRKRQRSTSSLLSSRSWVHIACLSPCLSHIVSDTECYRAT
jgi:hypothetical protein